MADNVSPDKSSVYDNRVSKGEVNGGLPLTDAPSGTEHAGVPASVMIDPTDQASQVVAGEGRNEFDSTGKRKENGEGSETEGDVKKLKNAESLQNESQVKPSAIEHCDQSAAEENGFTCSKESQPEDEGKLSTSADEGRSMAADDDDESASKSENVCIVCWKSFTSAAILGVHVRSHENIKLYPCYKCRKSFKTLAALFRHEQTSLHNSDVAFSCEICLAMFETKKYLNRHIVRMHKKNHCDVCAKKFCTESELESHDCERPKFPKYHCDGCIQVFPTEGRFVNHQNTTKCDRETLFKCGICCLAFDVKRAYLKHMHGHMGGDGKPYVCATCNKGFDILANLELHMPRHKGSEALKCGVCDKRYEWVKKGYYKQHIHLHIGKTPYVCGICLKRYKNFSSVQNHLKVTHFSDRNCPEDTTAEV